MLILNAFSTIKLGYSLHNKRQDGYFNISTILLKTELHDEILIQSSDNFDIVYNNIPKSEIDNIIKKSVNVFKNYYIIDKILAKIIINKRIPINYGFSSRISIAMTLVKGLAKFLGIEFGFGDLNDISLIVNPELEFFNTEKNATIIDNGQVTQYLDIINPYHTLIVFPKINYNFETFEKIIEKHQAKENNQLNMKRINSDETKLNPDLFIPNNIENFIMKEFPELRNIKSILEKDALFSTLNGKGSSLFAFYDDLKKLELTVNILQSMGYHTEIC